ncbi:MAG: anti-phage dCTP deaminase [Betaproteobacteria bacterium]
MSAAPQPKVSPVPSARRTSSSQNLSEKFSSRRSNELVIAFAGPIGCGIGPIIEETKILLAARGYEDVVHVKLSDFLQNALNEQTITLSESTENSRDSTRYKRYRRLQEAGKELRRKTTNRAILAEYAVQKIVLDRLKKSEVELGREGANDVIIPKRVAYLIDQVKRPEEVDLLRAVYRNLFYLIGVTRIKERRVTELTSEGLRVDEIPGLMEIDRSEDKGDGQQLDKTLHLSDYFIRNDTVTVEDRNKKIDRVLALLHGDQSITPTDAEQGMYAAYAAGLRSACLSRQVGASIVSPSGEILATGCNDVPRAGGGLYSASSPSSDMRCVHHQDQICFNDLHKRKLREEISNEVESYLGTLNREGSSFQLLPDEKEKLAEIIYEKTRLGSLIEFSRSVHAEMDAIVSLARMGGGVIGATLFTTTFPCHSCARHIVAAGISKVFYIEPYEKSMAKDLHYDAIAFEVEDSGTAGGTSKVKFLHFEGVSPRKFQNFFRAAGRKDSLGRFVKIHARTADKVIPEYLDNYQDFEAKTVQHLEEELASLKEQTSQLSD